MSELTDKGHSQKLLNEVRLRLQLHGLTAHPEPMVGMALRAMEAVPFGSWYSAYIIMHDRQHCRSWGILGTPLAQRCLVSSDTMYCCCWGGVLVPSAALTPPRSMLKLGFSPFKGAAAHQLRPWFLLD
jgi:hypothetical protein